jgi:ABC-type Fe3+-hydroxamate transport system substrate-binding protein
MRTALLLLLALVTLSACGKRPEQMEAPANTDPNAYPRHYPDVRTDPDGVYILPSQTTPPPAK